MRACAVAHGGLGRSHDIIFTTSSVAKRVSNSRVNTEEIPRVFVCVCVFFFGGTKTVCVK